MARRNLFPSESEAPTSLDDSFDSSCIGISDESEMEEEAIEENEEEAPDVDSDTDSIKISLAEGADSEGVESDSNDPPTVSSSDESSSDDDSEEEEVKKVPKKKLGAKVVAQINPPKIRPTSKVVFFDDNNVDMIQHHEILSLKKKPSKRGITKSNKNNK